MQERYGKLTTLAETESLSALLIQAAKEQTFRPRYDPVRVRHLCLRLFNRMPGIDHLLAWDEDKLIGYFIWQMLEDLLTGDTLCKEISLYLLPEYRGTVGGGRIAKVFADTARRHAVKVAVTAPDANVATLEKLGYVKYGNAMLLDTGQQP